EEPRREGDAVEEDEGERVHERGALRALRPREALLDPVPDLDAVGRVHALHREDLHVPEAREAEPRVELGRAVHGLLYRLVAVADRQADAAARGVELRVLERLDDVVDAGPAA